MRPIDPAKMHEASMNFDLENVRPFLEQLEASLALGLDVTRLFELTERTALDTTNGSAFEVQYQGATVDVRFAAFMDDIDAPDLYFHVSSEQLASAIDAEMEKFCEAMGI
ncbi:MAG: hypothetical protein ABJ239_09595 [Erythrobacter sp.]